ncbi:DUF6925 family protein [Bosea sp. NPDC055353]
MIGTDTVRSLLRDHLLDAGSQWNLGTFGAIAEFMRDAGEPFEIVDEPDRLSATTARGGVGFGRLDGVRLHASESAVGSGWNHRVALCLPEDACAMNRRTVLTELGPDAGALRPQDAAGILFDMGLGTLQADICIRTADPALIAALRGQAGRSLFEPGNPAMGVIVAAGPHRVFIARFGRCEVYQPIPPADGRSPEGPHTHVLPQLLRSGRTHAATEPMPEGFVPCAHLVPAHPLKDSLGRPHAFDREAFLAFETLVDRFGDPALIALKRSAREAIAAGLAAEAFEAPRSRFGRQALRVFLRQAVFHSGNREELSAWSAAFDPRDVDTEDGTPADPYAH